MEMVSIEFVCLFYSLFICRFRCWPVFVFNGLKLPSFFGYTLLIWDCHMMSPGRSSLPYFKRSLYNLYRATGFLPWIVLGLSFCYSSTSLTKIAKPEHSTLLRPNCHPKTPGTNRATGAFFWDFRWNACAGAKGDFFARSEGIGCIWKALVTFFWWFFGKMNLSKNQNQKRVKRWSYIYIYIYFIYYILYIIYHISYMYCL